MTKTKLLSITFIVSLLFFVNGGVTLAAPLATPTGVNTSASDYTVLAPLPCVESPDAKYVDSNGVVQTIPGSAIKCDGGNGSVQEKVTFKTYIQYMMNLLIALAAVAAVVMIVWGGIEYMTANTPFGKGDGRKRITNAVGGLLLVLCSYLLLRTIDPRLVEIPNTLVPEITLRADLALDASGILKAQIEGEANRYQIESREIGAQLQQTLQEEANAKLRLKNIEEKLLADPTNQSLLLEKAKVNGEIQDIRIKYQKTLAKSAINGVLISATGFASDTKNEPGEIVTQLDKDKANLNTYRSIGNAAIIKLGESNLRGVNEPANYSEAMIDLIKVGVIINDAKSQGKNILKNRMVSVLKIDGSRREFISLAEANTKLQTVIDGAKMALGDINDPNLKTSLQAKIDETTLFLNSRVENLKKIENGK